MEIATSILNTALEATFKAVGKTYVVSLLVSGGTVDDESISFNTATSATITSTGAVYVVIPAGVTINTVRVRNQTDNDTLILEDLSVPKTYTSNGTFTISGVSVVLQGGA